MAEKDGTENKTKSDLYCVRSERRKRVLVTATALRTDGWKAAESYINCWWYGSRALFTAKSSNIPGGYCVWEVQ